MMLPEILAASPDGVPGQPGPARPAHLWSLVPVSRCQQHTWDFRWMSSTARAACMYFTSPQVMLMNEIPMQAEEVWEDCLRGAVWRCWA